MLFEVGLAGRVLAWADFSTPVKVRLIARVIVGLVEFGGCGCDAKLMCVRVGGWAGQRKAKGMRAVKGLLTMR